MANQYTALLYNAFSVTSVAASQTQGAPLRVGPWATMYNAFGVKLSLRDQLPRSTRSHALRGSEMTGEMNKSGDLFHGLTFHHPNRLHPGDLPREVGVVDDFDHFVHVLVGVGLFFGKAAPASAAGVDAALF